MSLERELELTKKAVDNNELKKLFLGETGYEWGNLKHIPALVLTDIGAILEHGLYVLYKKGNTDIPNELKTTVFTLLKGTPIEIWTAYSIIWHENWYNKHNRADFCIYDSEMKSALTSSINTNKVLLMSCKELVGKNLNEGLWEDIYRLENNLYRKYGEGLI